MKYLLLIKYFFLSCFILILAGCVTTKHLIGERIQEDLSQQFDGIWEVKDVIVYFLYTGNGVLQIAWVDWETDKFELVTGPVILTKCGANKFMHWSDQEHTGENVSKYGFAYFSFTTAKEFKSWPPKEAPFEKAITEGIISGEIGKIGSIKINEPGKSLCDFIQTRNIDELFDVDEADTFNKIK